MEGVKEKDIKKYWNMNYLEREIAIVFNDHIRIVGFLNSVEEFENTEDANNDVRKHFPILTSLTVVIIK